MPETTPEKSLLAPKTRTNGRGVVYGEPSRNSHHEHDEDCDRDGRDDRDHR